MQAYCQWSVSSGEWVCDIYTILNLEGCKCARARFYCANGFLVLRSCEPQIEHGWIGKLLGQKLEQMICAQNRAVLRSKTRGHNGLSCVTSSPTISLLHFYFAFKRRDTGRSLWLKRFCMKQERMRLPLKKTFASCWPTPWRRDWWPAEEWEACCQACLARTQCCLCCFSGNNIAYAVCSGHRRAWLLSRRRHYCKEIEAEGLQAASADLLYWPGRESRRRCCKKGMKCFLMFFISVR